jgi:hypothetical protein
MRPLLFAVGLALTAVSAGTVVAQPWYPYYGYPSYPYSYPILSPFSDVPTARSRTAVGTHARSASNNFCAATAIQIPL